MRQAGGAESCINVDASIRAEVGSPDIGIDDSANFERQPSEEGRLRLIACRVLHVHVAPCPRLCRRDVSILKTAEVAVFGGLAFRRYSGLETLTGAVGVGVGVSIIDGAHARYLAKPSPDI